MNIVNGTVIFSEPPSFRKANNFLNLTQLNIIDFGQQLISPELLYLGNPEDLGNGVGGLFCSQTDADSESRNRFRFGANLKFFVPCHSLTYFLTSITSVT